MLPVTDSSLLAVMVTQCSSAGKDDEDRKLFSSVLEAEH